MNTTLDCTTCDEDETICACNEYSTPVFFIQLTMTNPHKWANPEPFIYSEDDGEPITFETYDAALVMSRLMFGKNTEVKTRITRSN